MGQTILLAEDNDAVRGFLSSVLSSRGYSVVQADDGERALEELAQLQQGGVKPDLLITDFQMPGVNGGELCRRVKSNPMTGDIPVIMLSSVPDLESEARSAKADAYLAKPFDLDDLYTRVGNLLHSRKSAPAVSPWDTYPAFA